jgi:penicillin-binding protein 1C
VVVDPWGREVVGTVVATVVGTVVGTVVATVVGTVVGTVVATVVGTVVGTVVATVVGTVVATVVGTVVVVVTGRPGWPGSTLALQLSVGTSGVQDPVPRCPAVLVAGRVVWPPNSVLSPAAILPLSLRLVAITHPPCWVTSAP